MNLTYGGKDMQSIKFLSYSKSYVKGYKDFKIFRTLLFESNGSET